MNAEYIKYRQKQLEKIWRRDAELEAAKEAKKEAEMEAIKKKWTNYLQYWN
jgi:hypothetical protein